MSWKGFIPAISTPFAEDGSIAWADLDTQLGWLQDETLPGVIVAGTTGEWFSMSDAERAELFRASKRCLGDSMWVIGGCTAYTAREVIVHARAAEAAGLDGILVTPPPYIVPNAREIVQFYQDISDATNIPLCVYNWPRGTGVDLRLDVLSEIVQIENVVAVKDNTGDLPSFLRSQYALHPHVRFFNLPTSPLGIDLAHLGRSDGLMGSGAVLGAEHPNFWRAIDRGDLEEAHRLGQREQVIKDDWNGGGYGTVFGNRPAIVKTALRLRGVPAGFVRRPLLDLTPAEVDRVRASLHKLDIETVEIA